MDSMNVNDKTVNKEPTLLQKISTAAKDVSDANELAEALSGIRTDVKTTIKEALADKSVSKEEKTNLSALNMLLIHLRNNVSSALQSARGEVEEKYKQINETVSKLISDTANAITGNVPEEDDDVVDVSELEPLQTDSPQYARKKSEAYAVLEKMKEDKARAASEINDQSKYFKIYVGDTPEEIGMKSMEKIAHIFLGSRPTETDVNKLLEWANEQYESYSIDHERQEWTSERNISLAEKRMLEEYAEDALVGMEDRKEREKQNQNSQPGHENISYSKPVEIPKYDRDNDGHNLAWKAVSDK